MDENIRNIESYSVQSLEEKLVNPFREIKSPPKPKRKKKPLTDKQIRLNKLKKSGIAYTRLKTIDNSSPSIKLKKPLDPLYDIADLVDINAFTKDYERQFSIAHQFWTSILCESMAYDGAYTTVVSELKQIPAFAEMSTDTTLTRKLLKYHIAKKICDHLNIDVDKALESGENGVSQLLNLLKISQLSGRKEGQ